MTAERIDRYGGRWPDRATLETIAEILWPDEDADAEWSADTLDLIGAAMTDAGYRPADLDTLAEMVDAIAPRTYAAAHAYDPRPDDSWCRACNSAPGEPPHDADAADLDALADELVSEYAAAVDRIRDRAIESRYGGRILRSLTVAPAPLYANLSDAERLALAESLALE